MVGMAKRPEEDKLESEVDNRCLRRRRLMLYFSFAVWMVAATATALAPPRRIVKADVKRVCMIHNKAYGDVQHAFVLNGHTYYVFCDLCKAKLAKNVPLRYATDPISGKRVDKAMAIIGVKPSGDLL